MGKHFDALVDFARNQLGEDEKGRDRIPSVKKYLDDIIRRAALFEFPILAENLFPESGKDYDDYWAYVSDYFDMSAENKEFFAMPFKVTAIEDDASVVIMDNKGDNKYIVTIFRNDVDHSADDIEQSNQFVCAYTSLEKDIRHYRQEGEVSPESTAVLFDGRRVNQILMEGVEIYAAAVLRDTRNAAASFVEQLIYIMDSQNFILRKENTQSIRQREKDRKRKRNNNCPLKKTIMRPHYICLSEEDIVPFMRRESIDPVSAHPVRGHWRRLVSDRFIRRKGQRVYIAQYFTGDGEIKSEGGWTYQVMVKDEPGKIIPYHKSRNHK